MDKIGDFIFDIIIAILIVFIAVLIYFGLRTETVIKTMDSEVSENFLSDIKKKGSFTTDDYENFMYKLSITGVLYDVNFEHKYHITEPEYRMRTIEEIIAAQKAQYQGDNIYHYKDVITEKPVVTDPIDNSDLTMNTETNESVLAGAVNTPSIPGHVHNESCYAGHLHKGKDSLNFTHTHMHTSGCREYTNATYYDVNCNNCGAVYQTCVAVYHLDQYGNLITDFVDVSEINNCRECGKTNPPKTQIIAHGYSCGYSKDITGDGFGDIIPSGVSYTYSMTYPQSELRKTYTNGCYTYHKSNYLDAIYGTDIMNELNRNGYSAYCRIPLYYSISASYTNSSGLTTSKFLYFTAAVSDNGIVTFNYTGYSGSSSIRLYFPTTIDANTFLSLRSLGGFKNFVEQYSTDHVNSAAEMDVTISGILDICGHTTENKWVATCGLVEDATIICNLKVVSIVPTHPVQAVYVNENLITTAKATYQDGSTKVVLCTTNYVTSAPAKGVPVTISYTDARGNTLTGIITVTVIPKNKTCINGHIYNLNYDGSDPGCPFCKNYVANLRIIYPNTSTLTITIGTSLQENGIKLLATYMDGHTEIITDGYLDNLDRQYLGTKMVTIGYKGASTQILVTTICAKMTCDICGFIYDLYPDGTNPGCPRCISKTPVFTGNVLEYDVINYTEEILDKLYQDGIYKLSIDNNFTVSVKNKSSSLARNILHNIYPSLTKEWLYLTNSENIKAK
jgi:hypothetical protein